MWSALRVFAGVHHYTLPIHERQVAQLPLVQDVRLDEDAKEIPELRRKHLLLEKDSRQALPFGFGGRVVRDALRHRRRAAIAGGAPLQLTRDASEHLRPRWSPDSSSLLYFPPPSSGGLTGTLSEISALGGAPRRIVDSLADGDVSHDGRRLAFVRSAGGRLELVTADRDGTNAKVIVHLAPGYSYVSPRWSPDDTLIAYQRNRMSLDDDVFVVPASGGEPRRITQASNRMSGFACQTAAVMRTSG